MASKRIAKYLKHIQEDPIPGITANPRANDLFFWDSGTALFLDLREPHGKKSMLDDPILESPANPDAAKLYSTDRRLYNKKVRAMCAATRSRTEDHPMGMLAKNKKRRTEDRLPSSNGGLNNSDKAGPVAGDDLEFASSVVAGDDIASASLTITGDGPASTSSTVQK